MKTKTIVPLLLVAGLALGAYRSSTVGALGDTCLAAALLSSGSQVQRIANEGGKHRPAPNWELKDVSGKTVKLSDFKGKVVLLNFWATWCPPCREEIPDLVALQKQYAPQGLIVIGVSVDEGGAAIVKSFVSRMHINYPVVLDDQKTAAAYGDFQVIPTTFFINRKGEIVGERQGAADKATFEAEIKPLLSNSSVNL